MWTKTFVVDLCKTHGACVRACACAQAFASPAKVADLVARVNEALAAALPPTIAKLRLYLPNPHTYTILFKPIKSSIAEAHSQMGALVAANYTAEEAAGIPLKGPEELSGLLDALCS